MKRFLKCGLAGLFVLLLLLGSVTVHTIVQAQTDGRLINYVGIVRGATQRLVKLELADKRSAAEPRDAEPGDVPSSSIATRDELIEYLDGILDELNCGNGQYGLPCPDDKAYQDNLSELEYMWTVLKAEIYGYRAGTTSGETLVSLSEDYFEQANVTVFAADDYSAQKTQSLLAVCVVMLAIMLLTWAFIFWAGSRKMLSLESTNKELSDLTRRDPLTGAYHLDAFKEEAQRLLDEGKGVKYAVVYTDFADFKYINDVFGYAYGDRILTRYGDILRSGLRDGELYGRVSADNFVLLLTYQDKEEAAARQRRADEQIIRFMHSSYDRQSLPTCCGICCVEDVVEELKIEGLLDRANFARKTVKNGTNPNYVYYNESIRNRLREEKTVESRMQAALENREFVVYYQPKVELKTGKIACAEALVRWKGPAGVIPPDQFIPVFEQKFMINLLDQYVFEEVCRWQRRRLDAGKRALAVSVNVSRLQFYDPDFVSHYASVRDKYRIPPELLEIEFTESIVFDNTNLLVRTVHKLKEAGFACSIDDFGKGYSSLSLLKNLPVDIIKIDSFFFSDGEDRERDMAVVQGIVELVRKFHIRTVAEGIESPEQVKALKRMGCDFVQGYVFYRPVPEEEFDKLLDSGK